MKVGFTGTGIGMTDAQKSALKALLIAPQCTEFHHPDYIGASSEAHDIAADLSCEIVIHPPCRPPAYPRANRHAGRILDVTDYADQHVNIIEDTDYLIVASKDDDGPYKSGCFFPIRMARRIGRKIVILYPNGKAKIEEVRK